MELYASRHPHRPLPTRPTFTNLFRRFCTTGSVHLQRRTTKAIVDEDIEIDIVACVTSMPELSIRQIADNAERPVEFVDPFPLMNLPEQLIEYVLSFVSHEDLLKSCRYTCKLFREIIDSNGFWKIKCLRDGKSLPMFHLEELPQRYYQRIYIGNPYGRNLLRNGHGDSPKGASRCVFG
ncbi:hypothetical protein HPB50_001581 [Hyalomma asiaticum]|uniref:Uncharacterized protein n=1 Tax=Hyalomma asiaticum TaxID=266040 RepID=A0ACB7SJY7_HYAAI|nr:hypothetical protein HPB50_001581 [Hyalomma asiaticum]